MNKIIHILLTSVLIIAPKQALSSDWRVEKSHISNARITKISILEETFTISIDNTNPCRNFIFDQEDPKFHIYYSSLLAAYNKNSIVTVHFGLHYNGKCYGRGIELE